MMAAAVCIRCGRLKPGALLRCPHCGFVPEAETDLLRSLAMSERFFPPGDLIAMSMRIAAGLPVAVDARLSGGLSLALKLLQS